MNRNRIPWPAGVSLLVLMLTVLLAPVPVSAADAEPGDRFMIAAVISNPDGLKNTGDAAPVSEPTAAEPAPTPAPDPAQPMATPDPESNGQAMPANVGDASRAATGFTPIPGQVAVNGSVLNIRTGPWGKIIGRYPDGTKIQIIGESGDWYKVKFLGRTAYVHKTYVKTAFRPVEGRVDVDGSKLNVRSGPWGKIIGRFSDGAKVHIVGQSGDWYKISYQGRTGFVHKNYVDAPGRPSGRTRVTQGGSPSRSSSGSSSGRGRFGGAPCSPMPRRASSEYGPRRIFGNTFHNGIDLPVPSGTRLNSLGDGVVIATGWDAGGGRYVKIRYDNGYESFYCHLQSVSVRTGQRVARGAQVARSDNTGQWTTGAHLHMGIYRNGRSVNPRSVPGIVLP